MPVADFTIHTPRLDFAPDTVSRQHSNIRSELLVLLLLNVTHIFEPLQDSLGYNRLLNGTRRRGRFPHDSQLQT